MKSFLFPHRMQKIAFYVLIADFVVLLSTIGFSLLKDKPTDNLLQSASLIVFYLSLFCCVFSQEKKEDEYIASLRLRSVSIVAFFALVFIIVLNAIQLILPYEKFLLMKEWRMDFFWNGNFILSLAVVYFLILKINLKVSNKG